MPETLRVLLSKVWVALVIETDSAVEAAMPGRFRDRFRISLPMWANGLRLADGTTVEALERATGARVNLPGLERWGWVALGERRRGDDGFGTARGVRPETTVRLTSGGRAAAELWPETVAEVERRWLARFGDALLGIAVDPAMPWALPEVHPPDGFRTAVIERASTSEEPRPLVAVLGGMLTCLTLAAERDASASLPIREDVLHALRDGPLAVGALPAASGIAKEGVAMALASARRSGFVDGTALTPAGRAALDQPIDGPDDGWLRAALEAVLAQPEALREGLRPPAGSWRGERPHLARTERLLADPVASLPRHPMVLHRGGWPDGS